MSQDVAMLKAMRNGNDADIAEGLDYFEERGVTVNRGGRYNFDCFDKIPEQDAIQLLSGERHYGFQLINGKVTDVRAE